MRLSTTAIVLSVASCSHAFVVSPSSSRAAATTTQLYFGIPGFLTPKNEDDNDETTVAQGEKKEKEIGLSGVVQLITAGMGAPFLGDYEGVSEDGKFMFSLEANNLVDENGESKQTQMPYFESGWVDPEDEAEAKEGFKFPWQN